MIEQNEPARIMRIPASSNHNIILKGDNFMADFQVPKSQRICQVEGCTSPQYAEGHCHKHRKQMLKYGYIRTRTMFDPNTFVISGDVCQIGIFNRKCAQIAEAIIDAEDYQIVKQFKWSLNVSNDVSYISTMVGKDRLRLHSIVMGTPKSQAIDHKDHDTYNNRKSNLRECTPGQNRQNSKVNKKSSSDIKNVYKEKSTGKWIVSVQANKTRHYIGRFANIEDAKQAAIKARKKYHGEFACV